MRAPLHAPVRAALAAACLLFAGCGDGPTEPAPDPFDATITGRVVAPVPGDFGRLRVLWSDGALADSSRIAADGTFSVRARRSSSTGELRIHAIGESQFHPFLHPVNASAEPLTIVLVPRRWTVSRGVYAGETVDVSLDLAMDYFPPGTTYYNVSALSENELLIRMRSVLPEELPLQVVIDHDYAPGDLPFTAADSIEMWRAFDRMEEVFGRDLFVPATGDASWFPSTGTHTVRGVVRVKRRDRVIGVAAPLSSTGKRSWQQDLGAWAADGPYTRYTLEQAWLDHGELHFGNFPHDSPPPMGWPVLYTHEMMHILGVGHTSRFPTPMGPGMRTQEPSRFDVAYIEMKQAIMLLQQEHDTHLGLMPATIGQRRIELGLSALPDFQNR